MERALTETYGTFGTLRQFSTAGMTDRSIVYQALSGTGLSADDIAAHWELFAQALALHMAVTVRECHARICPGVSALLAALSRRTDVLLGLVTGNLENTAPIKLRAVGIEPGLFLVGGFGSDDTDRNRLPAIAASRAEMLTGRRFAGGAIVVVGDTAADVASGRAVGARIVAVATGVLPVEALQAARPDALLMDLSDLNKALTAILV